MLHTNAAKKKMSLKNKRTENQRTTNPPILERAGEIEPYILPYRPLHSRHRLINFPW